MDIEQFFATLGGAGSERQSEMPTATALTGAEASPIVQNGVTVQTPVTAMQVLKSYSKTALPAQAEGAMIYVTDATGGSIPAYSDGTNWRRMSDGSIVN